MSFVQQAKFASSIIQNKMLSFGLVFFASLVIFAISQVIHFYLAHYELHTMYISFVAGFILFISLVSLVLHPLLINREGKQQTYHLTSLLANIGLVCVVQLLCFLIWITDAIALYSLYVDQNSFLAQVFEINAQAKGDMTFEFYCFNFILAWCFALLSMIIGVLPCFIARLENLGVVADFVAAFSFAKKHKRQLAGFALLLATSVLIPLLYAKYLFLLVFPSTLVYIFIRLNHSYLANK